MEKREKMENNNEFTVIETQEQLDSILKGRLEREAKKHSEATAGLQSEIETLKSTNAELSARIKDYDEKYSGIDEKIATMQNTIKTYESDSVKTRVAREFGIPYEMRDRLRGETEDEIRADAETFKKLIPQNQPIPKSTEVVPTEENDRTEAYKKLLKNL